MADRPRKLGKPRPLRDETDGLRRLQGIVESAMDGIVTIDEAQRVVTFNLAAEKMFGVSADDAIGAPIERFIPERFRAGHAEHIRRFEQTGVTNRRMGALGDISGLRANGEQFPLEASISQIEVGGEMLATVILRDVTERKASEEARKLMAREIDYRAKNTLAMVQSVISLTRADTNEAFVEAVKGRVEVLGRAHRELARNRWTGANLAQIVVDESGPYQRAGRIKLSGSPVVLAPDAVQPISLLIHELATNAVKYGALSADRGRVEIEVRFRADRWLELRWTEVGGPPVRTPTYEGFGTTLVNEVATRQLRGTLQVSWLPQGLTLVAALPPSTYRLDAAIDFIVDNTKAEPGTETATKGRVLIVENESLIALALCKDLQSRGWEIVGPAAAIDEGFSLIAKKPLPDVAVLDVNLGGTMVYALADRLKSRGVPFVFCTGYDMLDQGVRYKDYPVIRKPVVVQELSNELQRIKRKD